MLWKWCVMFGLGTLFGVCLSWLRFSAMQRRTDNVFARRLAQLASTKRTPRAERPTARVKIGVLPFDERPTIVHTSSLLPDMIPTGPPVTAVCGTIEID